MQARFFTSASAGGEAITRQFFRYRLLEGADPVRLNPGDLQDRLEQGIAVPERQGIRPGFVGRRREQVFRALPSPPRCG